MHDAEVSAVLFAVLYKFSFFFYDMRRFFAFHKPYKISLKILKTLSYSQNAAGVIKTCNNWSLLDESSSFSLVRHLQRYYSEHGFDSSYSFSFP